MSDHRSDDPQVGAVMALPQPPDSPAPGRGGRWPGVLAVAALSALVAVVVTVPLTVALTGDADAPDAPQDEPAPPPDASAPGPTDISAIAEALLPSVARVDVALPQGQGSGSAVVYREDGYLLTNEHVVRGARAIEVTLPDGTRLSAEVVGADEFSDLAVLRVDPPAALPEPPYADDEPRIGEPAIAIGSPFQLDGSVTAGIVSAVGRTVPGTPLRDMLQTDAPINPGNSGGALVNERGEVIGINTAILGAQGNVGIGFAIPVTHAVPLADELIERGFVQHAQLGVQAQTVDARTAEVYGLAVRQGAMVAAVVEGSPAEEAGLQSGDIITELGGVEVTNVVDLIAAIRAHDPGEVVEIRFWRGGGEERTRAELAEADLGS